MSFTPASRLTLAIGALFGATGVITAAAASHVGDPYYGHISAITLAHGPVLVALALFGLRHRLFSIAALLLALGTVIFCTDLLVRSHFGHSLFPFAAPIGGFGMIGGWVVLFIAAIVIRS